MAEIKTKRTKKKQLGQFMTPIKMCYDIVNESVFTTDSKILEPSFGCGNFIIALIDKLIPLYDGNIEEKITTILNNNIWGVELDPEMYSECLEQIKNKWGFIPQTHNLISGDFLLNKLDVKFNYVIGNPPFGGTINPKYQNSLDRIYGFRDGFKIKKETYSFFMIKSIENLTDDGKLIFISSDTFLTIKTMTGLRHYLFNSGYNKIKSVNFFSEETNYPMIILSHNKSDKKDFITLNDLDIPYDNMKLTDNFSWFIQDEYVKYFKGDKLSKFLIGSSGMTIGKNELFLRDIEANNTIVETYDFSYFDEPITLSRELERAKNNILSNPKIEEIKRLESNGITKRNVRITKKENPSTIQLPNEDYCYYNKSSNESFYAKPTSVIYWKDDGDAVITFKKTGNWYLHGVGGKPFFKRKGLTWQLISSSIKARFLPEGYILDSGSPIAVLKDGVNDDELYFIIGWLNTSICNTILKKVINHTKNIQSKDIEKLPYPFWVSEETKKIVIDVVKQIILDKQNDKPINVNLEDYFIMK